MDYAARRATSGDLPQAPPHVPRGTPRRSRRAKWRAFALLLVHALIAAHLVHFRVVGRTLSPLEPSEAGEALAHGVVNAGCVFLLLLLVTTLVFGRFFCGWACHVVAYQDACAWLLGRLGLRPKPVRSRALALVPLLAAFLMFGLPPLLRLTEGAGFPRLSWHLSTDSFWERFPGPWIGLLTLLVCGGGVVWLLGSKGFCTYGCPYGALFGAVERLARGRIRVTDACEGCGHCTATCTSNVRVHEEVARFGMVVDPGCMKCMDCVDVCPKEALYFGFGPAPSAAGARRSGTSAQRSHDFSWPEELVLALGFLGGLYAFRGLYDAVPLLLALALAVLAAVAVVVLGRLALRADVRLQHVALKRRGRLSAAGLGLGLLLAGIVAFAAHSAWVQVHAREGARLLARAAAAPPGSPEREVDLADSARHLGRALELGLFESLSLRSRLGQIELHRGRLDAAEGHLQRALELSPRSPSGHLYLAEVELARGEVEAACARAEQLFEIAPHDPFLPTLLAKLLRRTQSSALATRVGELRRRVELARSVP